MDATVVDVTVQARLDGQDAWALRDKVKSFGDFDCLGAEAYA